LSGDIRTLLFVSLCAVVNLTDACCAPQNSKNSFVFRPIFHHPNLSLQLKGCTQADIQRIHQMQECRVSSVYCITCSVLMLFYMTV